jgi:hypothetical protein
MELKEGRKASAMEEYKFKLKTALSEAIKEEISGKSFLLSVVTKFK